MIKYYNDYNVALKEPMPTLPYVEADVLSERSYICPTTELVNIFPEVKRMVNVYFEYATPEQNYACCLIENSPVIWDVSYVKDGKLENVSGTVKHFEFRNRSLNVRNFNYSLNGVRKPEDSVVIQFDCSMENRSEIVTVDLLNIRALHYSEVNSPDMVMDNIKIPRDGYNFMERLLPVKSHIMPRFTAKLDFSECILADMSLSKMYKLEELQTIKLPKAIRAVQMCEQDRALKSLVIEEAPVLTNIAAICNSCNNIKSVSITKAPKITNIDFAFLKDINLESITLDADHITSAKLAFAKCKALKDVNLKAQSVNCDIEIVSNNLTPESIKNILEALDTSTEISYKCTFKLNTICPPEAVETAKAAYAKGWKLNGLLINDKLYNDSEYDYEEDILNNFNLSEEDKNDIKEILKIYESSLNKSH